MFVAKPTNQSTISDDVGGLALTYHFSQKIHGFQRSPALAEAMHESSVSELIWINFAGHHLMEKVHGIIQLACHAETMNDGGITDNIGRTATLYLHVLEELLRLIQSAMLAEPIY